MPIRQAEAEWEGKLSSGHGEIRFDGFRGAYSAASRMQSGAGTNPEQLLGAAHAACFSMALALELGRLRAQPRRIHTRAAVHFDKSGETYAISGIELDCEAEVEGVDEEEFEQAAERARLGCPVSKALAGTEIRLRARRSRTTPERNAA
ncbi:MAG: OsmC family peroxiredoxin [Terriglobales bacterium]